MSRNAPTSQGFADRTAAGRELVSYLGEYEAMDNTVVLGLPRGGIGVAAVVARELSLPLDVLSVRKLGTPGREELAMGAIASGGAVVLDHAIIDSLGIPDSEVEREIRSELAELERREELYRDDGGPIPLRGKQVIVVDDGAATGTTMLSAIDALRELGVKTIVVAVPVASRQAEQAIEKAADRFICPLVPRDFYAVGMWFGDFHPVSNREVQQLLREARTRTSKSDGGS